MGEEKINIIIEVRAHFWIFFIFKNNKINDGNTKTKNVYYEQTIMIKKTIFRDIPQVKE